MVPSYEAGTKLKRRQEGQVGFICSSIKTAFRDKAKYCGIYEWQARGTFVGQPDHVIVYVGSTCRGKPGALRRRILEYCTDGSHKEDLMNDALDRGYELWVRVKVAGSHTARESAEDMENELLDEYDYGWNVRNNGRIRHYSILP